MAGLLSLTGCTTLSPVQRSDTLALQAGFERRVVRGTAFRHVIYQPADRRPGSQLHVYIEGDGRPWSNRHTVAPEPTPGNPLMLRLMRQDPAPSIYLGRPCYFGLASDPGCTSAKWTWERYSREVITSMKAALTQVNPPGPAQRLVLFGHSGGGTLAMLLARQLSATVAVVTVGGNLDTDAWTRYHSYTPLHRSLNPATDVPLPASILQWHYVGLRDRRVPPALTRAYAALHAHARVIEVADYDHDCCWERDWSVRLQAVETALATAPRNDRTTP